MASQATSSSSAAASSTVSACSSPSPVPSLSPGGPSPSARCIRFDLAMDLVLLRQLRGGTNPFLRGCPGYEEAAVALDSLGESRFSGITKKGVRDRAVLLMEAHQKGDQWRKKQSGSDEQFSEKTELLTELTDLKREASEKLSAAKQGATADRQAAILIRDEAAATLGPVKRKDATLEISPNAKKTDVPKPSACSVVVDYLREKSKVELEENQRKRELEERRVAVEEQRAREEFSDEARDMQRRKMELEEQKLEAQREKERAERAEARAERESRQKREDADRAEAKADREAREKRDDAMMALFSKLVEKNAK